jgi:Flp pilus assembly protein TadG
MKGPRLRVSEYRKGRQRGAAMVEGALVMVVFLFMLFGLMDFGRMVWSYTTVAHSAREATRFASVHGSASGHTASASQIQGIVTSSSLGLDPSKLTTTVTFTPDQSAGSTVKVSVSYSFSAIAPYIPVAPIALTSTSQMVIYQ